MNKIDFTLVELLNALKAVKCIIKGHPRINNCKWKKTNDPKSKGKRFHYGFVGH